MHKTAATAIDLDVVLSTLAATLNNLRDDIDDSHCLAEMRAAVHSAVLSLHDPDIAAFGPWAADLLRRHLLPVAASEAAAAYVTVAIDALDRETRARLGDRPDGVSAVERAALSATTWMYAAIATPGAYRGSPIRPADFLNSAFASLVEALGFRDNPSVYADFCLAELTRLLVGHPVTLLRKPAPIDAVTTLAS